MPINSDSKKDIATEILSRELNIVPTKLARFTTGNCHSVYYVEAKNDRYVLRVTSEANKIYHFGSVKWLNELVKLAVSVPKILSHGRYGEDIYYVLITFICGKDLGEIYHTLNDYQKRDIVKALSDIQKKVATLPSKKSYGHGDASFVTWSEAIKNHIERSRKRIRNNNVFDMGLCDAVDEIMGTLENYFSGIEPVAFLDDITTKNVLIHEGRLDGIVDIDEICYGDPLLTVGLTKMALLAMRADTRYIDYWLDEMQVNDVQMQAVTFYTLLFCIDFMGEQGMKFANDNVVEINQEKVELLSSIYSELLSNLHGSDISCQLHPNQLQD